MPASPFYQRIKRLGIITLGKEKETITQAAMVESLVDMITNDPKGDRDSHLIGPLRC